MKNFEPSIGKPATKEDFLKTREKAKFKIGKLTGTLHFHGETLRHSTGEFSLNRIYSIKADKNSRRVESVKKEKVKNKVNKRYNSEYKRLCEETLKVLNTAQKSKRTPIKDLQAGQNLSVLRAKSRKYLTLSSIF